MRKWSSSSMKGASWRRPFGFCPVQPGRLGHSAPRLCGRVRSGRVGMNAGFNIHGLVRTAGRSWVRLRLQLNKTGRRYQLACKTQHHHSMEEAHTRSVPENAWRSLRSIRSLFTRCGERPQSLSMYPPRKTRKAMPWGMAHRSQRLHSDATPAPSRLPVRETTSRWSAKEQVIIDVRCTGFASTGITRVV